MTDPVAIGLRGKRGGLTQRAAAEVVALDVLGGAGGAVTAGVRVDAALVARRLAELQAAPPGTVDARLREAAGRASAGHVVKICQAWAGGIAASRRRARR